MNQYPFDPTPESEIYKRIERLKHKMDEFKIDALFLTHKPDLYYFSGSAQDSYLYIEKENDPVLFVKRYLPRAIIETPIQHIEPINSFREIPQIIKTHFNHLPKTCGLAFDVVPIKDFKFYETLFKGTTFLDGSPAIMDCRKIKSTFEIEQMKQAAIVSQKTYSFMEENLKPGISEMTFCGLFESYSRTLGHSGKLLTRHYRLEGFPFHLLSGKNGGLPGSLDSPLCGTGTSNAYPYGAGPKLIQKNEPILIDFGTIIHGYHMDETRMFVIGEMPQKAMNTSLISIEILNKLKQKMAPGVSMEDIFQSGINEARKNHLEDHYLGLPDLKSNFVGHGIGVELVETPILAKGRKAVLEPGMVFAVEPKFIFKNKFAAGIESVIHITETGSQFLSRTEHKVFTC